MQDDIHMQCEKDSFYHFDGQQLTPLVKNFSRMAASKSNIFSPPTTLHSIGGFYATISNYVFENFDDVGKLMGLAPFGTSVVFDFEAFEFQSGNVLVNEDWKSQLTNTSQGYDYFKTHLIIMPM